MTVVMELGLLPLATSATTTPTTGQIIELLSSAIEALPQQQMAEPAELKSTLATALEALLEAGDLISQPGTPVHVHRMWSCYQRHMIGVVYLLLGDFRRAESNLDVAIEDLRATPAAYAPDLNLAYARLHRGLALMGLAMEMKPSPATQQAYLAHLHNALREFDGAADNFGAIEPAYSYMQGTALVLTAEAAFFAGEYDLALTLAAEASDLLDWFSGFENVRGMLEFCAFLPQAITELREDRQPQTRPLIAQTTMTWDFKGSLPLGAPA